MKNQRDKLHQYQKRITTLTDRETAIAKECLARNDRRRALLALRRKKYQQSLLAKTDAQLAQLEQLTSEVEFALVQKDVVFGLQQGTKVLQAIQKEMGGLAAVEKLMGETEDARVYQEVSLLVVNFTISYRDADVDAAIQEVSRMLAGQMSNQDEDEVEDELEALQREIEGPVHLPDAPMAKLPEETEEEKAQKAKARAKVRAQERAVMQLAA
jgi:charged multivesicular body protein 6